MEHVWTVICRESIVDSRSNNISLVHILEQINFSAPQDELVEGLSYQLDIVSLWVRSDFDTPEEAESRVLFVSPQNEELARTESTIDLTEYKRLRAFGRFLGIPFRGDGVYKFVVEIQTHDKLWKSVATIPLEINHNSESQDQTS